MTEKKTKAKLSKMESDTMNNQNTYSKMETIIMEKVFVLESENAQLKNELAIANAKLEVYERLASISDSKVTLGFGPPINKN